MRLTIEQRRLDRALARIRVAVNPKAVVPIYSNLVLEAETEGRLLVRGGGERFEIEERLPAEVAELGSTTVPAHQLADIVHRLPAERQLVLSTKPQDKIEVTAEPARFSLPTKPAEDYPLLGTEEGAPEVALPAASLVELFERSVFAASTEDTRAYLNGVCLQSKSGNGAAPWLRAITTDGHRLARIERVVEAGDHTGMIDLIVPHAAALAIGRIFGGAESAQIGVTGGRSRVRFAIVGEEGAPPQLVLTSRLVDASFVEYERVIPQGNNTVLQVARKALLVGLDRVMTLCDKHHLVKLAAGDGDLAISTEGETQFGEGVDHIAVDYIGPAIAVGFNGKYLVETLSHCAGEEIEFRFGDPGGPALIGDLSDPGALHVLMPMRL